MATKTPTVDHGGDGAVKYLKYAAMANGDIGSPIAWADWADRSVGVYGTFGVAGNLRWEGSNKAAPDPAVATDWHPLSDPQGNVLDFTTAKHEAVTEVVRWARPRVTAGDGATALDVEVVLRRPNNMRS